MTSMTTVDSAEETVAPAEKPWKGLPALTAVLAVIGVLAVFFTLDLPGPANALIALLLMFALMATGMPVGIAMALSGTVGLYVLLGERALIATLVEVPFRTAASTTFLVVPMFIFMGLMLWRSGITTKLYMAARVLMAKVPGNLAVTTNIAGAGLGAVSGSTIGITYAVGRMGIPEMLRAGYDRRLALGSVLSSGTIAQLIPPSIMLIIFAGAAEVPVGPQLMAGVLPGILLTLAYVLTIVIIAVARPKMVGKGVSGTVQAGQEALTFAQKARIVAAAWPVPVLMIVILGGMGVGWLTAIESAAIGAVLATLYALVSQGAREFAKSFLLTVKGTLAGVGSLMLLVIGAAILTRLLSVSGAAQWLSGHLKELISVPVLFFAMMILLYLILGMFMDSIAMILLTVPLLLPVVVDAGYSPLWFGVFVVLMAEIGVLTPPVGVLVYIGHRIMQDPEVNLGQKMSLKDAFTGAMYFVPIAILLVVILTMFPELVTWIPELTRQ